MSNADGLDRRRAEQGGAAHGQTWTTAHRSPVRAMLAKMCAARDMQLVFDEAQTGLGRTGTRLPANATASSRSKVRHFPQGLEPRTLGFETAPHMLYPQASFPAV